jgi:tetratricopeptide (TPR) repeat protein
VSSDDRETDERVADLVEQVLEQRASGAAPDLLAMAGGDDALCRRLEQALEDLEALPAMFGAVGGDDAWLGRILGERFELVERIGAGAMGMVYRANDRVLGRDVAVKLLRSELPVGERMAARLEREAEVLANIRDRNVITVFDRGRTGDGRAFFVMDLLRGESLVSFLADGGLDGPARLERFRARLGGLATSRSDLRTVAGWLVQACAGVQAAHDSGVLHRDLKPSNLFVERDGRVVVLDFGIGSVHASQTLGSDGSPLGTPAYMAPEQLGEATVDARTDVYGLAATLYHLVTGKAPFDGAVARVLHGVARQEPPVVDRVRPGVPRDLAAIVEKGMDKDPARRYASAAELGADLEAWLEHRPVEARRMSLLRRTARRVSSNASAQAAAGVLLLVVLVLGAFWWRAAAAERDRSLWLDDFERVGSSLVNDLPTLRSTNALVRSERLQQGLDRMVGLAVHPGISLGLRAVNRIDLADHAGAARDLERIADVGPAPFALALAAELRAGRADPLPLLSGERAPELGCDADRFVAVLLGMRLAWAAPAWIEAVLAGCDDPARPGLADLIVLQRFRGTFALDGGPDGTRERHAVLDDTARLRARRGATSGVLLHVRANVLLRLGRAEEALAVASEGIALCPDDYLFHLAHGHAAYLRGRFEAALASLQAATSLQPSSLRAHRMSNDTLLELGRFDEAAAQIDRVPWQLDVRGAAWRCEQEALLAFARGCHRLADPAADDGAAAASFALARERFVRARQLSGSGPGFEEWVCAARAGERSAFTRVLESVLATPADAHALERLSYVLPPKFSEEEIRLLARLLRSQAAALEGRDR